MYTNWLNWADQKAQEWKENGRLRQEISHATETKQRYEPSLVLYHYHARVAFGSINVWENGEVLLEVRQTREPGEPIFSEWAEMKEETSLDALTQPYLQALLRTEKSSIT